MGVTGRTGLGVIIGAPGGTAVTVVLTVLTVLTVLNGCGLTALTVLIPDLFTAGTPNTGLV